MHVQSNLCSIEFHFGNQMYLLDFHLLEWSGLILYELYNRLELCKQGKERMHRYLVLFSAVKGMLYFEQNQCYCMLVGANLAVFCL